jgi:drug/metabolite transporter (DMT)-like permease
MTAFLFTALVTVWGFTWFAIKLQLGPVAPELSICYRFLLAAAILWVMLAAMRRLRSVPWTGQGWLALLGLTLFSLNFLLIYLATQYIASGVVSVLFTTATLFNAFHQWLFLRRAPSPRVVAGALCGIAGIALLFLQEFSKLGAGHDQLLGIGLAIAGTYVFSLGNMASIRAVRVAGDLPNAIVRGMTWGVVFLALFAFARGVPFVLPTTLPYLAGLVYLAVPGSIIGFFAYLSLLQRVGPDRAAYATVLFPVLALAVSTFVENYVWTLAGFAGLALVLAGNLVIFARLPGAARRAGRDVAAAPVDGAPAGRSGAR